ncbi:MAG: DUF2235 domain-containing protein [Proteobacteria bacterium]|nr:DUF2235 domain-containing protein [Pseudomonadota bacterium]
MKRLVCSMDGTWNDDVEALPSTNVAKLTRAVLPFDHSGVRQLVRYVAGIPASQEGSMSFEEASGSEIGERIRAAYQFLTNTYEPGDEIYLFGFSRGAYEARSLASFIALFGIARKDAGFAVEDAWLLYRQSERRRDFNAVAELSDACHYPVRIRCIGAWDTVEYAGASRWPWGWLHGRRSYHDIRWHDTVDVVLHALAIDETRRAFRPAMFTLDHDIALPPHQHVEQAWFAGSHEDVGGGWPETELSDITLLWMADKIRSATDLAIDIEKLQRESRPDPLGLQHAPSTGWRDVLARRFPYLRLIQEDSRVFKNGRTSKDPNGQSSLNETVDESALARLGQTIREKCGRRIEERIYQPPALQARIPSAFEDEA